MLRLMRSVLILLTASLALPAEAAWFESLIYDMPSDKSFISRAILNDTSRTNLYTISAWRIDRPGKGGEKRIAGGEKDLLYAPLKFTVQPKSTDYFKLYYRGPADDIERYYRVDFSEAPVTLFPLRQSQRNTDIVPVVVTSTILVVRPRKAKLQYEVDEKQGTIRNSGNTFFRVIIHKGCNGDDESSTQFYMLPGEHYRSPQVNENNRKFIVAAGRYQQLGKGCFNR